LWSGSHILKLPQKKIKSGKTFRGEPNRTTITNEPLIKIIIITNKNILIIISFKNNNNGSNDRSVTGFKTF